MRTNALPIVIESMTEEERDVDFLAEDTVFEDHNCRALRGGAGVFGVRLTGKDSCTASGNEDNTFCRVWCERRVFLETLRLRSTSTRSRNSHILQLILFSGLFELFNFAIICSKRCSWSFVYAKVFYVARISVHIYRLTKNSPLFLSSSSFFFFFFFFLFFFYDFVSTAHRAD